MVGEAGARFADNIAPGVSFHCIFDKNLIQTATVLALHLLTSHHLHFFRKLEAWSASAVNRITILGNNLCLHFTGEWSRGKKIEHIMEKLYNNPLSDLELLILLF